MAYTGKKPIDVIDATTAQSLEVSTALEVDTIKDTGGTTAIEIDSSGVVTMPVLPAWRLEFKGEAYTSAGGKDLEFLTTVDDASTDNRRFMQGGIALAGDNHGIIVNKTGVYQINANVRIDGVSTGYIIFHIMINGSSTSESYFIDGDPSSLYQGFAMSHSLYLRSGDEIVIRGNVSSDTSWSVVGSAGFCSGYLVG